VVRASPRSCRQKWNRSHVAARRSSPWCSLGGRMTELNGRGSGSEAWCRRRLHALPTHQLRARQSVSRSPRCRSQREWRTDAATCTFCSKTISSSCEEGKKKKKRPRGGGAVASTAMQSGDNGRVAREPDDHPRAALRTHRFRRAPAASLRPRMLLEKIAVYWPPRRSSSGIRYRSHTATRNWADHHRSRVPSPAFAASLSAAASAGPRLAVRLMSILRRRANRNPALVYSETHSYDANPAVSVRRATRPGPTWVPRFLENASPRGRGVPFASCLARRPRSTYEHFGGVEAASTRQTARLPPRGEPPEGRLSRTWARLRVHPGPPKLHPLPRGERSQQMAGRRSPAARPSQW